MNRRLILISVLALGLGLLGCAGDEGDRGRPGPTGPTGPTGPADTAPGLEMVITSATIPANLRPVVEFTLHDGVGDPLELTDLDQDPRFVIAYVEVDPATDLSRYQSYIVIQKDGADYEYPAGTTVGPALTTAPQVTYDTGGVMESLGGGAFRYTFATVVPAGYDQDAFHTLAGYVHRENRAYFDNAEFQWVPSGNPPLVTRDTIQEDSCNPCHGTIAEHGGVRSDLRLCQVCHTDQTVDPETGENVDLKVMIHKIHRGKDLVNLPYYIVGYYQSVHDYTTVGFPQDLRNCTKCHTGGADSDYWKTKPSAAACGSCHDDVDFVTGAGHLGGPQPDTSCAGCHPDTASSEFDLSVPGAHTVSYTSTANPDLTLDIYDVQNMTPGNQPEISFRINDNVGPVDINTLEFVNMAFAGPTEEYTQLISLDHRFTIRSAFGGETGTLQVNSPGDYTYFPEDAGTNPYNIPASTSGTWAIGMEARTAGIDPGNGVDVNFGANNPVVFIDTSAGTLGGGTPTARRQIVDEAGCNVCHDDLRFHGNLRTDLEYCMMCHNPWATDEIARDQGAGPVDPDANPPETIHMPALIHQIHRGDDLANPYLVWGFGPTLHDYSEVKFPGNLANCETCHLADTWKVPLPANAVPTVINVAGVLGTVPDIHTPTASACNGCHDSTEARNHTRVHAQVTDPDTWLEDCLFCHGEGEQFDAEEAHK